MWGFWKPRQPRQRPRWGWGQRPTPSPPPPPNNNDPPPSGGGGGNNDNSSPEPVPAGSLPDPSVYNWAVDRTNQEEVPLDKNNGQCPSRGAGVTVFILDTGCRTTHQVGRLVGVSCVSVGGVCGRVFCERERRHGGPKPWQHRSFQTWTTGAAGARDDGAGGDRRLRRLSERRRRARPRDALRGVGGRCVCWGLCWGVAGDHVRVYVNDNADIITQARTWASPRGPPCAASRYGTIYTHMNTPASPHTYIPPCYHPIRQTKQTGSQ